MSIEKEKISRLANTGIFSSVPEEQLSEIASVLKLVQVPANTILFRKGDPADDFYIVHFGKLKVYLEGENRVKINLNRLGPGDSFGEMALLTDEPRSTHIKTIEETQLLVLNKTEFDSVLRKYPDVYKNCIKHLSQLLKRDESRILSETEREYKTAQLKISDFIFIGIVTIFFATIFNLSNPNRINVLPEFYESKDFSRLEMVDAKKKFDSGQAVFIDARPSNFYDSSHIKGALNLPLPSFEISYMYMAEEDKEKDIIIYGRSLGALYDEEVARQLSLFGHENIEILQGKKQFFPLRWVGLDTWKENGYPVEGTAHE